MLSDDVVRQRPDQFLACTGLTVDEFDVLFHSFSHAWEEYRRKNYVNSGGGAPKLPRVVDKKSSMTFLRTRHCRRTVDFRAMNLKTSSPTNQKKPHNGALSIGDKLLNRIMSGTRIVVEHVICGVKRCRIVKDILRNTRIEFEDIVMEIACSLHNFRQKLRSKSERVNIFDMM